MITKVLLRLLFEENAILDGTMTVLQDSASINIASGKTLMYRGDDVELGTTHVVIEGRGRFNNVIAISGTAANPVEGRQSALLLNSPSITSYVCRRWNG